MAKVTSFSEMRRKDRKKRRMQQGITIAVAIVIGFFLYTQRIAIESLGVGGWLTELFLQGSVKNYPVDLPNGEDKQIEVVGSQITVIQSGEIGYYNLVGEPLTIERLTYKQPLAMVMNRELLLADMGAYGLRIDSGGITQVTKEFTTPTIGIANTDNRIARNTSSARYVSAVEVYDSNFQLEFTYNSAEYAVATMAVSDRMLVVGSVTTKGGRLSSRLVMINTDSGAETVIELGEVLPFHITIMDDHTLLVLTDKEVLRVSAVGGILAEYFYEYTPVTYEIQENGAVWLVEGDYTHTRTNKIVHLNSDLEVESSFNSDQKVQQLLTYYDTLLAVTPQGIIQYNHNFEVQNTITASNISDATILDRYLYFVTSNSLHRQKLTR